MHFVHLYVSYQATSSDVEKECPYQFSFFCVFFDFMFCVFALKKSAYFNLSGFYNGLFFRLLQ